MDDSIFYLKKEVCAVTRLSPAHIDRLERDGKFPRRFNLTGRPNGEAAWYKSEVQDWCLARSRRMLKPPSDSLDGDRRPPA
jgi:predicted DNA-binding transcriptional regulator AlpA